MPHDPQTEIGPKCPECNGYGTADGEPACIPGVRSDFSPNAPGPCDHCAGTGEDPAHSDAHVDARIALSYEEMEREQEARADR